MQKNIGMRSERKSMEKSVKILKETVKSELLEDRGKVPWWQKNETEELTQLLGKCGHFLFHRPERGRMQEKILNILTNQKSVTQKELQEKFLVKPGSISEIISKLEDRGLLVRERDENDRRRVVLKITEKGRETASIFLNEEKGKNLYACLNKEEKETLKKLLRKLVDSWYEH